MGMDRELEPETRRRTAGRRIAAAAAVVALLTTVLVLLPGWLRPAVARERIRTARVERGPVEAVIAATGTVVPAVEQVVSSPFEARVTRLRRRLGAVVAAGDELMQLDTSGFELERRQLADQMEQKANLQLQLRLGLDKSLGDLAGALEIKRLDADLLEARAAQNRRLAAEGLVSAATLRVAEVEAHKAQIEVRQLAAGPAAARAATAAQLAALDLDLHGLRAARSEIDRQLALSTPRAAQAGVVTWMVEPEGVTVHRGDVLARIADLDAFRVEATVSDIHSASLRPGLPVRVLLEGQELPGRLATVHPLIEDGAVKFAVDLLDPPTRPSRSPRGAAEPLARKLRANLRVDVLVVTERRPAALRLRKGPFVESAGIAEVFVVRGGEAVRRRVRLGLAGYDCYEVEAGLAEGDEVVISDMKDYLRLTRVALK
jgi:HlyD family secretion protein